MPFKGLPLVKVLVVEDNIPVRQTIADVLQLMDHEVHYSASAEEALETLEKLGDPIDLLISDISLPGLDGISLLRRVQRRYPRCKGLLTSGLPRSQHRLNGAAFMQKPFTLDQFMTSVEAAAQTVAVALPS